MIPFALAYGAGILLGAAFTVLPLTVVAGLLIVLALTVRRVSKRPHNGGGLTWQRAGWLLVALLGGIVLEQLSARLPTSRHSLDRFTEQGVVQVIGMVDEPPRHTPDHTVLFLTARLITPAPPALGADRQSRVSGRVRLSLQGDVTTLHYGDLLKGDLMLSRPRGFLNPGGFDYGRSLVHQGVFATATVRDAAALTKVADSGNPLLKEVYRWRDRIREAILADVAGPPAALLLAMVIGETGFLTQEIREAFMASGTTHILSISGSHLGMIAVVIFAVVRYGLLALPSRWLLTLTRVTTPTRVAALLTIPPVVFYTLLSGSQVATVRSLIMILVYLLAILIQREEDLFNSLALAAVLILLAHPLALFEISFQLSFLSVLCLAVVLARRRSPQEQGEGAGDRSRAARLKERLALYGWMTAAAVVGTAPLVAFYFNQVAWVGLFANAVVIPFVGFIALPVGLLCSVASLAVSPPHLPLAGLNETFFSLSYWLVRQFARLPFAELHVPSPSLFWLVACYGALLLLVLARSRVVIRLAGGAIILLTVWLVAPIPRFHRALTVTFLDVGQGDAALIEFPGGRTMVVDAGGAYQDFDAGRLAVAPYLWDRRVRRLDYIVASHPQVDHIGGLPYLLSKFSVGEVWTNGVERTTEASHRLRRAIRERKVRERVMSRRADPIAIGNCRAAVLNPPAPASGAAAKDLNNQALVLRVSCPVANHGDRIHEEISVLFTGDIERKAERDLVANDAGGRLRSRVLKVPHHGSKGSLDPAFLRAVEPDVAVFSAGAHNPYGHPTPEALEAYRRLGAQVYRTDTDGAVIVKAPTSDDPRLLVATYRDLALQPVPLGHGILAAELANYRRLLTTL